jgi:hypothetical protein
MKTGMLALLFCFAACASDPSTGPGPVPSGDDQPDPPPPSGPKHGDICVAPAFNCGTNTNLVCVVDRPGDSQGTCRAACNGFSTCLQNDEARKMFDNDCCDIGNGGRVCDQEKYYPAGACD